MTLAQLKNQLDDPVTRDHELIARIVENMCQLKIEMLGHKRTHINGRPLSVEISKRISRVTDIDEDDIYDLNLAFISSILSDEYIGLDIGDQDERFVLVSKDEDLFASLTAITFNFDRYRKERK